MAPHHPSDWKKLAEQASNEYDPQRFTALIQELDRVLAEREETMKQRRKALNQNLVVTSRDADQP